MNGFDVGKIPQLGVEPSPLRDIGGELQDGSIILTDLNSLESHQPKQFSIDLDGHHFSGSYEGVFALKAAKNGAIEKLACGACSSLDRDGEPALRLAHSADLILTRNATGDYEAVVEGSEGSNKVELYK